MSGDGDSGPAKASSGSRAGLEVTGQAGRDGHGVRLLENLVAFGGVLRRVGIPVSPQRMADAGRALTLVDLGRRREVFHALRALLVSRQEDLALFETVFRWFWRGGPLPDRPGRAPAGRTRRRSSRFTIANWAAYRAEIGSDSERIADRTGTVSPEETLQRKRFSVMSPEELEDARRLLARFSWRVHMRVTRRKIRDATGPLVDLRRVLGSVSRTGSVPLYLPRRRRRAKERPVVLLADISGSMENHSRLLLQFFHLLVRSLDRVEAFVFATRLTRITPHLRLRNVDRAIDRAALDVMDWSGGTRIGECLGEFNRRWSRRVLGRGAVVVIVSDGCDSGDPALLSREMRYLRHRCHRLIWLHPYAGSDRFQPRVAGLRAVLSYVDDLVPAGNVRSLIEFSDVLAGLRSSTGAAGRAGRPPGARAGRRSRVSAGTRTAEEGTR